MKGDFTPAVIKNGICFAFVHYTPRNNEFEKGLRYKLYVDGEPTGWLFSTLKEAKQFVALNWSNWL